MMNSFVYTKVVNEYKNIKIAYGKSDSKIHAINRNVNELAEFWTEAADWDIIVVMSDDMMFLMPNWDEIIRMEMKANFPDGDGYLHFQEKDTKRLLNVMEIMDRTYYERFGFIYHPSYLSLWCDNEKTELAKRLRRYKYIDTEIFVHENPAYAHSLHLRDEMFDRQQADWGADEANFYKRKALNFEIEKWGLK